MRFSNVRFTLVMHVFITGPALAFSIIAAAQGNSGMGGNSNLVYSGSMIERLDRLEAKLDAMSRPEVTATFCISQGRGLELGGEWAVTAPVETEAGIGWAEVGDVKLVWAPTIPLVVPLPPLMLPFPLPTQTSLGLNAGLGRMVDICVDLPIELEDPNDIALLAALADDINARARDRDASTTGKFQRRAGRLLNYAKRRVPGIQSSVTFNPLIAAAAVGDSDSSPEDEFDRLDEAMENLMSNGLASVGEGLGAFRDPNVVALRSSFDGLPRDVAAVFEDPEMIFDAFDNLQASFNNLTCDKFGVTDSLRLDKPGLDRLCNRLEGLPDFDVVQSILSGEQLDAIKDLLQPLLENNVQETAEQTKARICGSVFGRLFKQC